MSEARLLAQATTAKAEQNGSGGKEEEEDLPAASLLLLASTFFPPKLAYPMERKRGNEILQPTITLIAQ